MRTAFAPAYTELSVKKSGKSGFNGTRLPIFQQRFYVQPYTKPGPGSLFAALL